MVRRYTGLLLVLLLAAAAVAGAIWWRRQSRPREITVAVFSDFSFRQRPKWQETIHSRFQAVTRIYEPTKVRWKIVEERLDPTVQLTGIDERRLSIAQRTDTKADLLVILTGTAPPGRTGSLNPFSHAALIVDQPADPEEKNVWRLAHELAHLFGAPHEDASVGSLMSDPPASGRMSERTVKLIRALRDYNFAAGAEGLDPSVERRAIRAFTEAFSGPGFDAGKNPPPPAAQAHAVVALALRAEGRVARAIPEFREAVNLAPKDTNYRVELSSALAQDLQTDEAAAQMRQAVDLEPGSARLRLAMAVLLSKTNDIEAAADQLHAALQIRQEDAGLHAALGAIQLQQAGEIQAAVASLETALRLDPNLPGVRQNLDKVLAYREQMKSAVAAARSRVQQAPANAVAHYGLGAALLRSGDSEAAAAEYRRALELRPNYGEAHAALAEMNYRRGDYSAAWGEVKKSRAAGVEPKGSLILALKRRMPE